MGSPWKFVIWVIDLIGELSMTKEEAKYVIVAVDYFTKWVKADPTATITSAKVVSFVIKNIIYSYGVPYKIITDNGTQFESSHFQDFYAHYGIIKSFSTIAHSQANG